MADDMSVKKNKSGAFSFGIMIFSITILIPAAIFLAYAYYLKTEQEIKMKCIEQSKSYINGMCLQIAPLTK